MPSNFMSSEPFSATWEYRDGTINNVCATTGRAFMRALRSTLGITPADGPWDAQVGLVLRSRAEALNASQPGVGWGVVVNDWLVAPIAPTTSGGPRPMQLAFAIYLTYYAASGRQMGGIVISTDTIPPAFNVAPPAESTPVAGLVCFSPITQTLPLGTSEIAQAVSQSTGGYRAGTGTPAAATIIQTPSTGLGVAGVLGIAAALIAIGFIVTKVRKS